MQVTSGSESKGQYFKFHKHAAHYRPWAGCVKSTEATQWLTIWKNGRVIHEITIR